MTTAPVPSECEYEIFLHCLADDALAIGTNCGNDLGKCLREHADKIRDRLLGIADTVDKLISAGWSVSAPTQGDPVLLCWRDEDEEPFLTEESVREHLQAIAVPVDADFVDIAPVEIVDDTEDRNDDHLDPTDDADDDLFEPERRLYLVRWQNLSAALVMARSENDLLNILDEEADTTACSWWEYDGPLFLDFTLPVEWNHVLKIEGKDPSPAPEGWVPENIQILKMPDNVHEITSFEMHLAGCDTASAAAEEIFALAFPRLHQVFFQDPYDDDDEAPPTENVATAIRDEVARTMREHRKITRETEQLAAAGDREAAIARMMGTSVEQVQNMDANSAPPDLPAEQPLPPLVPPPGDTGN